MESRPKNLIEVWREREPAYRRLAQIVQETLNAGLRAKGIRCEVSCRTKAVDSFVKKMRRKGYVSPDQITDMAGARVVCCFEEDRAVARGVADAAFACKGWDSKRDLLPPEKLGYLGVHCQASLRDDAFSGLEGLECEIQFHTVAEHAWNAPLHDHIYKPPDGVTIPDEFKRSAYRLLALTELYDEELSRTRKSVFNIPGYKYAQVLRGIDGHFYALTGRDYDRELAIDIISKLEPLYAAESAEEVVGRLTVFVEEFRSQLEGVYAQHQAVDSEESAFILQPESVLIFEAIERDEFTLKEVWAQHMQLDSLEHFFVAWGRSLA